MLARPPIPSRYWTKPVRSSMLTSGSIWYRSGPAGRGDPPGLEQGHRIGFRIGHDAIEEVNESPLRSALPPALSQRQSRYLDAHAPGIGAEDQDPVGERDGLLDVVRHDEHGPGRDRPRCARAPAASCRSCAAVSTSSAENGSSMSRRSGSTTRARANPTRWRMPPESSFGNASSKPSSPMRSIARQCALAALRRLHATRVQTELDVLQHRQPRQQREALEDHGDVRVRAVDRPSVVEDLAGSGAQEPGHEAQQRALAAPTPSEECHDLALADRHAHVLEHRHGPPAVGLRKGPAHVAHLEHRPAGLARGPRSGGIGQRHDRSLLTRGGSGSRQGDRAAARTRGSASPRTGSSCRPPRRSVASRPRR